MDALKKIGQARQFLMGALGNFQFYMLNFAKLKNITRQVNSES